MTVQGIQCVDMGFAYHSRTASSAMLLQEIDAVFTSGTLSLITGTTGAGKSTLLHLLAGLLRPTTGEIQADGEPVSRWVSSHRDRWRQQVGMVFQHPRFLIDCTALENVILPLVPRVGTLATKRKRGLDALARVDMDSLAGRRVSTLSGGEQQRISLARAIVSRPRFLLVDEPTAHQDNHSLEIVLEALREPLNWDATVIVAAHDARLTERAVFQSRWHLKDGRLENHP